MMHLPSAWRLCCSNRGCEYGEVEPVRLQHSSEDGDEVDIVAETVGDLVEIARGAGWEQRPRDRWLCGDCAATHQPRVEVDPDADTAVAR